MRFLGLARSDLSVRCTMRFPSSIILVVALLLGCGPSPRKAHQTGEFPLDIAVASSTVWLLTQTYDSELAQSYGLNLYQLDVSHTSTPSSIAHITLPELAGVPQAMYSASLTGFSKSIPGVARGFGYFYKRGYQTTSWLPKNALTVDEISGFESEVAWSQPNPLLQIDEANGQLWFGQAAQEPAYLPLIDFRKGSVLAIEQLSEGDGFIPLKEVKARFGKFSFYADCLGTSRYLVTDRFAVRQPFSENEAVELSGDLESHFSKPGRLFCDRYGSPGGLWVEDSGDVYSVAISESTIKHVMTISPVPTERTDRDRTAIIAHQVLSGQWLIAVAVVVETFKTEDCSDSWFADCEVPGHFHSFGMKLFIIDALGNIKHESEVF